MSVPGLHAAARLAPDHQLAEVAAECLGVVDDPPQRGRDVEHAGGARGRVLLAQDVAEVEIAEQAESVVVRDHHDVVVAGERRAVVVQVLRPDLGTTVPGREAAAVRVEHHGPPLPVPGARRPDVEDEAVLARRRLRPLLWPAGVRWLNRLRPVHERVPDSGPRRELRGRLEAAGAAGEPAYGTPLKIVRPPLRTPRSEPCVVRTTTLWPSRGAAGAGEIESGRVACDRAGVAIPTSSTGLPTTPAAFRRNPLRLFGPPASARSRSLLSRSVNVYLRAAIRTELRKTCRLIGHSGRPGLFVSRS